MGTQKTIYWSMIQPKLKIIWIICQNPTRTVSCPHKPGLKGTEAELTPKLLTLTWRANFCKVLTLQTPISDRPVMDSTPATMLTRWTKQHPQWWQLRRVRWRRARKSVIASFSSVKKWTRVFTRSSMPTPCTRPSTASSLIRKTPNVSAQLASCRQASCQPWESGSAAK